jgi:hypothetical protein
LSEKHTNDHPHSDQQARFGEDSGEFRRHVETWNKQKQRSWVSVIQYSLLSFVVHNLVRLMEANLIISKFITPTINTLQFISPTISDRRLEKTT